MPPTPGRVPLRSVQAGHRSALVERIVLMGSALTRAPRQHLHVRDALTRIGAGEHPLRARWTSAAVLHRAQRRR